MNRQDTFRKIRDTIDFFKDRFNKNVGTRQNDMWRIIFQTISKLERDDQGNILPSSANLKILRTLRGDVSRTILTPQYKKDLNRFLRSFEELKGINDTYYRAIASGTLNANKQVFTTVKNLSIDSTKNSLLEAGINNAIIKPVQDILEQNITSGASFQDMQQNLREQILGDSERLGTLERYTRQITTDSLNQFNANYNTTVSKDLDLEFYYYSGSLKQTSRQYCINLVNEGRYFHREEIEKTSSQEWAGKIPGTNDSNIFIYRGGYNCGHQWLAVSTESVPKSARDRAEREGYYNP